MANAFNAATWMTDSWSTIGTKPLYQVTLPGTHDAGMSTIYAGTSFSDACNTQTQSCDIAGQLEQGSRYFDLRPVIWSDGTMYLGHFGGETVVEGSVGQILQSALDQVASFAATNNKELILLKFSHYLDYKAGSLEHSEWAFNAAQQQTLLNAVKNTLSAVMYKNAAVDTDSNTLNNMALNDILGVDPNHSDKALTNVVCIFNELLADNYSPADGIFRFSSVVGRIKVSDAQSQHAPAIAARPEGDGLMWYVMYLNDGSNSLHYQTSTDGGITWKNDTRFPMGDTATDQAPSMVCDSKGNLYCLYVNNNDGNKFCLGKLAAGEAGWDDPSTIDQWTDSIPTLAIDASDNLYLVFLANGKTDVLFCISTDGGGSWSDEYKSVIQQTSQTSPGATVGTYDGNSYLYVTLTNDNDEIVLVKTKTANLLGDPGNTANWSATTLSAEKTSKTTSMAALPENGLLGMMFTRRDADSLLFCTSTDGGSNWTTNYPINQHTDHAPYLASGSDNLFYAGFIQNGDTNVCFTRSQGNFLAFQFVRPGNLYLFDQYANNTDPYVVLADQFAKFWAFERGTYNTMFLLSWTCTKPLTSGFCIDKQAPYINSILVKQPYWLGHNKGIKQSSSHAPSVAGVAKNDKGYDYYAIYVGGGGDIYLVASGDKGESWGSPINTKQTTYHAASLACDGSGNPYIAFTEHQSSNTRIFLVNATVDNLGSWSQTQLDYRSNDTPAFVIGGSNMYLLYTDSENNGYLTLAASANMGKSWNTHVLTGQTSGTGPTLAVDTQGNLYALYVGNNHTLMFTKSTDGGSTWTTAVAAGQTSGETPSLVATEFTDGLGNKQAMLCALFRSDDDDRILYFQSADGGGTWSHNTNVNQQVTLAPSLTVDRHGVLFAAFMSQDGDNLYFTKSDGTALQTFLRNEDVSAAKTPNILYCDYIDNSLYAFANAAVYINGLYAPMPVAQEAVAVE